MYQIVVYVVNFAVEFGNLMSEKSVLVPVTPDAFIEPDLVEN